MDHLALAKIVRLLAVPELHDNGCVRRGGVALIAVLGACRLGFDDLPSTPGRECGIPEDLGSLGAIRPASAKVFDETAMAGEIIQLTGTIEAELTLRVEPVALDDASLKAMAQPETEGIQRGGHGGDGASTGDGGDGD